MWEWGADFTVENIQAFLGRPELGPWSRATYYAHLKDFCAWLASNHYLPEDPMPQIRPPGRPKSEPRPLSETEVALVLEAADGRLRDWLLLALLAGLRVHEIAKLRGEDITDNGLYVMGKGAKGVTLPVHEDLRALAERYPRRGYWFPSPQGGHLGAETISGAVSRFFDELGIEGSIHRARHTYATRLLRAGNNLRVVQKLMRHANLQTTAGYTAVDEDELAAAIASLPVDKPRLRVIEAGGSDSV
jgi:integrase/recombinase XerD